MPPRAPIFVMGDIHGYYEVVTGLLRDRGLIDRRANWVGGDAALWFLGDFFDRGPDSIGVVDLVMRLQSEAAHSGGSVQSLIGNHEIAILSALFFGTRPTASGGTFRSDWLRNGGQLSDLERITPEHIEWLESLPAMALVDGRLLVHADALLYTRYGTSVDEANASFRHILQGRDPQEWDRLLESFNQHHAFFDRESGPDDPASSFLVDQFLKQFGGTMLVHGHTIIGTLVNKPHKEITGPLIYANGLCVDVDGGIFEGGPGFLYQLRPRE
jgi:calcineurin-like phosphoesterase family protein